MVTLRRKTDPQIKSISMGQIGLRLRDGAAMALEIDAVARQPSFNAAIVLCVQASGLDRKQVYVSLGLDAATWSRIESGQANFPVNKLEQLMDLCGNEAPLMWLVNARGYDWESLREKQTEVERRVTALAQENADLRRLLKLRAEVET